MTQNTKKNLMYGGAIVVVSAIAYAIYQSKKSKLDLVDNAKVTDDKQKTVAEETTDSKSRSNYFASLLQNPLPKDIDYKFGNTGFK
jgi:hypothetical protein